MNILFFKALHIIGFVTWFAGMFYLVRLFVYHKEELEREDTSSRLLSQYKIMQARLFYIITNPGMFITWIAGLSMLYLYGMEWFLHSHWMHFKLALLLILTFYHLWTWRILGKLKKEDDAFNSWQFRLLNEVPTLLLVIIVYLAVFKNTWSLLYSVIVFFSLGVILFAAAYFYKKRREKTD